MRQVQKNKHRTDKPRIDTLVLSNTTETVTSNMSSRYLVYYWLYDSIKHYTCGPQKTKLSSHNSPIGAKSFKNILTCAFIITVNFKNIQITITNVIHVVIQDKVVVSSFRFLQSWGISAVM